jgi:hypothetical protein
MQIDWSNVLLSGTSLVYLVDGTTDGASVGASLRRDGSVAWDVYLPGTGPRLPDAVGTVAGNVYPSEGDGIAAALAELARLQGSAAL